MLDISCHFFIHILPFSIEEIIDMAQRADRGSVCVASRPSNESVPANYCSGWMCSFKLFLNLCNLFL